MNQYEKMQAEIAALRKQLAAMCDQRIIEEFAQRHIGNNILLMLAMTPYSKWPRIAQAAMEHAETTVPVAARMYKDRLPAD